MHLFDTPLTDSVSYFNTWVITPHSAYRLRRSRVQKPHFRQAFGEAVVSFCNTTHPTIIGHYAVFSQGSGFGTQRALSKKCV
jgi:hypothetical protein